MYTNPDANEYYATEMVERSEQAVERAEEIDTQEQMGGVYPAPVKQPAHMAQLSPEQAEQIAENAVASTDGSIAHQDTGLKITTPEQAEKEATNAVVQAQLRTAQQGDGFEAHDPVQAEHYATDAVVKSDQDVARQITEG